MLLYTTFSQMAFLFLLIAIGYILVKRNLVPENTESALSKLDNYIFIPALVLGTFMNHFTVDKLVAVKDILLGSVILELIVISISIVCVRFCTKDKYTRNIYVYGLCFSNFAFMGNALVSALFPDIFLEYLLFTIVLWVAIYTWGVPFLLLPNRTGKNSVKESIKAFINPMFVAMAVGMIIGLLNGPVPSFANNLVTSLGNCMSPIAMILTGMTVARKRLFDILKIKSIYLVTLLRLVVYPLIFIGIARIIHLPETLAVCALCSLAMPLGLNTIVIPGAYGKDTTVASGMALVSHGLSCITIPVMFWLLSFIV